MTEWEDDALKKLEAEAIRVQKTMDTLNREGVMMVSALVKLRAKEGK